MRLKELPRLSIDEIDFVRKLTDFVLDFMLKKVYAELAQFPGKVVSLWNQW
jgi:hypothetical protein